MDRTDLDEFLYSPKTVDLKEVLRNYEEYGTVETNWVWFNSNDHLYHPDGGLVKNFTSRAPFRDRVWMTHRSQSATNGAEVDLRVQLMVQRNQSGSIFGHLNRLQTLNLVFSHSIFIRFLPIMVLQLTYHL